MPLIYTNFTRATAPLCLNCRIISSALLGTLTSRRSFVFRVFAPTPRRAVMAYHNLIASPLSLASSRYVYNHYSSFVVGIKSFCW